MTNDTGFDFRWGVPSLDDSGGFTAIPNFILKNMHKLGMDAHEMLFVIVLASYKHNSQNGQAHPSLGTVGQTMGYAGPDRPRQIKNALIEKGLLRITERPGYTCIYDFRSISLACIDIMLQEKYPDDPPPDDSPGVPPDDSPGVPPDDSPGEKKNTKEEPKKKNIGDGTPSPADTPFDVYSPNPPPNDIFYSLNKTDQRTCLFSVICRKAHNLDPATTPRGTRADGDLKAVLTAYPDITPAELAAVYDGVYSALQIDKLQSREKLMTYIAEYRSNGKIAPPYADGPAPAAQPANLTDDDARRSAIWQRDPNLHHWLSIAWGKSPAAIVNANLELEKMRSMIANIYANSPLARTQLEKAGYNVDS